MLPGDEKHIGKELDKLYKIHNCSSITGKGGMGNFELEKKRSEIFINRCSINVTFDKISSGEEINFIFHKKLTKETALYYKIVLENHCIWDEFNSTDI